MRASKGVLPIIVEDVVGSVVAPTVSAEPPVEAQLGVGETVERLGLGVPRLPAGTPEDREPLAVGIPDQRVAGEQQMAVEVPQRATARVPGHGTPGDAGRDLDRIGSPDEIGGTGGGSSVVVVDPHGGTEVLRVRGATATLRRSGSGRGKRG
jgi:hypothetical protein